MYRAARYPFVLAAFVAGCGSTGSRATGAPDDVPVPVERGPGVRVFAGSAQTLEGPGCTTDESTHEDRWCGFRVPRSDGTSSLYVFDLSAVLAGVSVTCNQDDSNCLLLTDASRGSKNDYHTSFFDGETLVYYGGEWGVYAWRPGMDTGRRLVTPPAAVDIGFCIPAPEDAAVACLGFPFVQPDPLVAAADLYLGSFDPALGGGSDGDELLAPIANVITAVRSDTADDLHFDVSFAAAGSLAFSARETPTGPEVLKLASLGSTEAPGTIATDVHEWSISPDGASWLWLSAVDPSGNGVLQAADFPGGTAPRTVLEDARQYALDQNGTLAALTGNGDFVSLSDPFGAPDAQRLIDSDVEALLATSDRGHIAYAKQFFATSKLADLLVSKLDGSGTCTLDTTRSVPRNSVHFSPNGERALWALQTENRYDAYYTRLTDCSTTLLASDVVVLDWINDTTAIFIDDFDASTSSGSLRFRHVTASGALESGSAGLVARNVDWSTTMGPALLYTVHEGSAADGVYVRAFTN
jgi:hypothetical protein